MDGKILGRVWQHWNLASWQRVGHAGIQAWETSVTTPRRPLARQLFYFQRQVQIRPGLASAFGRGTACGERFNRDAGWLFQGRKGVGGQCVSRRAFHFHFSYAGRGTWGKVRSGAGREGLASCRWVEQLPEPLVLCPQLLHLGQLVLVVLLKCPLFCRHRADGGEKKTPQAHPRLLPERGWTRVLMVGLPQSAAAGEHGQQGKRGK